MPDITVNPDPEYDIGFRLDSDHEYITAVNTVPQYKDHVIHDLKDYRRTDQTILLLPPIHVALDNLLIFKE